MKNNNDFNKNSELNIIYNKYKNNNNKNHNRKNIRSIKTTKTTMGKNTTMKAPHKYYTNIKLQNLTTKMTTRSKTTLTATTSYDKSTKVEKSDQPPLNHIFKVKCYSERITKVLFLCILL